MKKDVITPPPIGNLNVWIHLEINGTKSFC